MTGYAIRVKLNGKKKKPASLLIYYSHKGLRLKLKLIYEYSSATRKV